MEAKQTPLIDLLESVPRDAVLVVEHDLFNSSFHPVGRLCHEAAAELRRLYVQAAQDEALLRQALDALEILRTGLIEMREHAESYGEAWARAYVKEYRELLPGSAEEQFRVLNAMQRRLAVVADGVIKGFDAIAALRERLGERT